MKNINFNIEEVKEVRFVNDDKIFRKSNWGDTVMFEHKQYIENNTSRFSKNESYSSNLVSDMIDSGEMVIVSTTVDKCCGDCDNCKNCKCDQSEKEITNDVERLEMASKYKSLKWYIQKRIDTYQALIKDTLEKGMEIGEVSEEDHNKITVYGNIAKELQTILSR